MRKPFWKAMTGTAVAFAVAACAVAASSAASTGATAARAAAASPAGAPCVLPIVYGPLAAMKAGSRYRRDLVTNQYDLPTPAASISPFFTAPHTVNVYFHVIMNGPDTPADDDSTGDIPQQWIVDQIAALNVGYAGTGFQFVLADTDRTENAVWFNGLVPGKQEKAMKSALRVGGYWDLNVYTADLGGGLLGWATFPEKRVSPRTLAQDGVVIYHESLPGGNADFGTDAVYNEGDTLTHEAGHWLSLYHTFQGGCNKKNDRVEDTPAHIIEFDCNVQDTCPTMAGDDPIHNFMNYTDDPCMTELTPGQTERMQANWDALRNLLPQVKNFTPGKGSVGESVTIKGSSLSGATNVYFNGTQATFTVNGDDSITATVPASATTGQIAVTGPNGTDTSSKIFKVEV
jgi:Pregnancy-associated plasma protein-A/IPT/TIG domain